MVSYLINNAGVPIIDPQGRLMPISGTSEFKQRIVNVFCTQKSAEILSPEYGFDYVNMLQSIGPISPVIALRTAVSECLNPRLVLDLQEVLKLQCQVTGTTGVVFIGLQKTNGEIYTDTINILNREE